MEIKITLTENELELLNLFKTQKSLSTYDNFGGWRDTKEFYDLSKNNLIHNCNNTDNFAYIRYDLTEMGELALEQNKICKQSESMVGKDYELLTECLSKYSPNFSLRELIKKINSMSRVCTDMVKFDPADIRQEEIDNSYNSALSVVIELLKSELNK